MTHNMRAETNDMPAETHNRLYTAFKDERWVKEHSPVDWRWRFLHALIVALMALSVIIVPLSLHAGNRKSEAERQKGETERQGKVADSHALAAHTKSYMRSDPGPSLRLTAGAVNFQETNQASDALRKPDIVKPLITLQGHSDYLTSAEFSPDGKSIVTASWDKTARVWDAANGKPLATLEGHTNQVGSAKFSPDGKSIVTVSLDKTARVWEVVTSKPTTGR